MIYPELPSLVLLETPMRFQDGESSEELSYLDVLAKEWASDVCITCPRQFGWKTAALIYEGLEWNYYYCYECRQWFRRHFRYRYEVEHVGDSRMTNLLVRRLESDKEVLEAELESASWVRKKLSDASRFFQRFLP